MKTTQPPRIRTLLTVVTTLTVLGGLLAAPSAAVARTSSAARPARAPARVAWTPLGATELARTARTASIAVRHPGAVSRLRVEIALDGTDEAALGVLLRVQAIRVVFADGTRATVSNATDVQQNGMRATVLAVPLPPRAIRTIEIDYEVTRLPSGQRATFRAQGSP